MTEDRPEVLRAPEQRSGGLRRVVMGVMGPVVSGGHGKLRLRLTEVSRDVRQGVF